MIRQSIVILYLLLLTGHTQAQNLIPFEFTSEEENRFLKENDSFKFYVSSGDSSNIVCINEETDFYKLLNRSQRVIAEGSYILDGEKYLQTGKWVERFDNGKVKVTGSYRRNKPIGTWQEYYPGGKVKTIYNYVIIVNESGTTNYCLSGTWQEFYPDGKLKVNGYYMAGEVKVNDTAVIEDPITDQKFSKITRRSLYTPEKAGTWEYYLETGELDKKEDF